MENEMQMQESCQFLWQRTEWNTARLLRGFGESPGVRLPEKLGGCRLTELGAYCFAEKERLLGEDLYLTWMEGTKERTVKYAPGFEPLRRLRPLCGSYVETVSLPDTVTAIGTLAFYHCTGLKELEIGQNLREVGGDAFMNCRSFHSLLLRGDPEEVCGVRQILAQVSHDLEVTFQKGGRIRARIFFPEYYESYDEIAPAHIFGRKIEGEGFRARQCFLDGRIDAAAYDGIFPKACVEESVKTLGRMAEDRLRYPFRLTSEAEADYKAYIRTHEMELACMRARERESGSLQFLCEQKLLSVEAVKQAVVECSRMGWAEGAASLLRYKEEMADAGKKRYEFEAF